MCLCCYIRPPTFLIWNKLCDLVYQTPTKSYQRHIPVAFGIPYHVTYQTPTRHAPLGSGRPPKTKLLLYTKRMNGRRARAQLERVLTLWATSSSGRSCWSCACLVCLQCSRVDRSSRMTLSWRITARLLLLLLRLLLLAGMNRLQVQRAVPGWRGALAGARAEAIYTQAAAAAARHFETASCFDVA